MSESIAVLVVDDEPNIRIGLAKGLEREADRVDMAGSANEAIDLLREREYDVALLDLRMPGDVDGLGLLERMSELAPTTIAIVLTAYGTVETAVEAMRLGAHDFVTKPVDLGLIREQVGRAVRHRRLVSENRALRERIVESGEMPSIIGRSRAMIDVFQVVRQVADTDATVFITGESGTGKELIAREIHGLSRRSEGPFVAVNVGAMPESLLESELFGHEKGAFSGAHRQRPGRFEQAIGGTLFLDEVTEMPAKSQIDLLRVLESGDFYRVGGEEILNSDARIVSATNRDVDELLSDGSFRADLFYRLNIVPIELPPLRRRRDDIPLLVAHFLERFAIRHRRPVTHVSASAMEVLTQHTWPGNVRQLRNVIERMVVTVTGDEVGEGDLPAELTAKPASNGGRAITLSEAVERAECDAIQAALADCDNHREQTARRLGVSVRTLHYKMNRYGLH